MSIYHIQFSVHYLKSQYETVVERRDITQLELEDIKSINVDFDMIALWFNSKNQLIQNT